MSKGKGKKENQASLMWKQNLRRGDDAS